MKHTLTLLILVLLLACGRKATQDVTSGTAPEVETENVNADTTSLPPVQVQIDTVVSVPDGKVGTRINVLNLMPKTKPNRFSIAANQAANTILVTPKGTQVLLAPNSLQTQDGQPYTGPVQLTVTDFPTASAAALAGLSTETTDGRLLQTRGMALVLASGASGQPLELIPGQSFGLKFRGPQPVGYSAYQGTQSGPNFRWKLNNRANKAAQAASQSAVSHASSTESLNLHNFKMRLPITDAYTVVEQMPEAGYDVEKYLKDSLFYTPEAYKKKIEGTVYTDFVVDRDGSLLQPRIVKGLDFDLNRIAMRLVTLLPNWKPGKQGGKAVPVRISMPVRFNLYKGVPLRAAPITIPNKSWSQTEDLTITANTMVTGFTRFGQLGYGNIDMLMKTPEGAKPLWAEVPPKLADGMGLTAVLIAPKQQVSVSRSFDKGQTRIEFPGLSPQPLILLGFHADAKGKITFARADGEPGQTLSLVHFKPASSKALDSLRNML